MINQSTFLHPPPENPHLSFPRSSTGDHSGSSNSKFTADKEEEEHFFPEDPEFAAEKKRREQFVAEEKDRASDKAMWARVQVFRRGT